MACYFFMNRIASAHAIFIQVITFALPECDPVGSANPLPTQYSSRSPRGHHVFAIPTIVFAQFSRFSTVSDVNGPFLPFSDV